jgi:hypothetical protein
MQSTQAVTPAAQSDSAAPETEELVRFREEWRQELARRKAELDGARKGKQPETVAAALAVDGPSRAYKLPSRAAHASSGAANTSHPAIRDGKLLKAATASAGLQGALAIYREAVQLEQKGELDAALGRYRQAFRLVRLRHFLANISWLTFVAGPSCRSCLSQRRTSSKQATELQGEDDTDSGREKGHSRIAEIDSKGCPRSKVYLQEPCGSH